MNRYFDNSLNRKVVTIYPGEFYVSKGPEVISTILGSCVAIVLFDHVNLIGGINHFMLANQSEGLCGIDKGALKTRFGNYAVELLLEEMQKKGANLNCLNAKIFGGSNILNVKRGFSKQIGDENISFAKKILAKKKIPIVAQDLGGTESRKIIFDPSTFKVLLKRIYNNLESLKN